MKNIMIMVFSVLLLNSVLVGQTQDRNQDKLHIIPAPQIVKYEQGNFEFPINTIISLQSNKSTDDIFAAQQLIGIIKSYLKVNVKIDSKNKKGIISLIVASDSSVFNSILIKENLEKNNKINEEGYILKIKENKIVILSKSSKGLFYGIQTLKQIIKSISGSKNIPCLTIYDWPGLQYRGWMADISRGPIPTVNFLKHVIEVMSEYKQNYFTLYTEHVFRTKEFPDIAPQDGISADEIKELTEYAKKYHIEVVGNEQSFGHMSKILSIPFYNNLRENSEVLNPALEETYAFLDKEYSEIAPAYSSKLFNINCDETYGLGRGPSKKFVDSLGVDYVYAYHINRIDKLLKKYGKQIMMWGDIAVNNKTIIDKLPKDLIILSWGYDAEESFDQAILPFKNSGFQFMVAPGVSCWSEMWPDMANACINISNYVRDGYKHGAIGMMNTAWADDGENLFNYNWQGLIWGAECAWKPASAKTGEEAAKERNDMFDRFNKSFDKLFYGCTRLSATGILSAFDEIRKLKVRNIVSDGPMWSSLIDVTPEDYNESAVEENNKVIEKANELLSNLKKLKVDASENVSLIDHPIFAAKRVLFTAEKNLVKIKIADYIKTPNDNKKKAVKESLTKLQNELYSLKKEYIELWQRENRGWWLDKVLDKYNRLGNQILNIDNYVFIGTPQVKDDKQTITLNTLFGDKDIYYTLNGPVPTKRSEKYNEPIQLEGSSLIRARVIDNYNQYDIAEKYILINKATGKLYKLNSEYSKYNASYAAGGVNALVDGVIGTDNFADGKWQGYQGQDINLILDFGTKTEVKKFNISCLQNSYSWVLLPSKVQLYASDDDKTYTLIKEIGNPIDPKTEGAIIHNFSAEFSNTSMRYLKVICVYPGDLPPWHHSAGSKSFIFADEIIVE